jgi:hypothetical protein
MMSGVNTTIEIAGLKDALKTLNKIDKKLRVEITREYRSIVKPVITDANSLIPTGVPLSGMSRNWTTKSGFQMLPWQPGHKQKIAAKINTRAIKEYAGRTTNVGTFSIVYTSATGTMFDMSSQGRLGAALTARYGGRSRVMWKAWERNESTVNAEMEKLVKHVMDLTNRELM